MAKVDAASPDNAALRRQTWRVLEQFQRQGQLRAIGVSNYELRHLEELLQYAEIKPGVLLVVWAWVRACLVGVVVCACPDSGQCVASLCLLSSQKGSCQYPCLFPPQGRMLLLPANQACTVRLTTNASLLALPPTDAAVNQVECHPRFQQRELRAFCQAHGIALVAYSSFGSGQLLSDPAVQAVAAAEGVTPAQALLLWGLQRGCGVLPKSVQRQRIEEVAPSRLAECGELSPEGLAALDALEEQQQCKYCWDPSAIA